MAFVTIASPSPISNSLWEVYYRSIGRKWIPPLPLDQDYALIKVLYTLFCHSLASGTGSRHLNISTFRLSVPFVPLDFSKLADDDEIFIVGHGDMNGIYAMGPDSEKNTDNLIRFLTGDGSLEKKRKNKPIKIILLSCRAGLGLHKKIAHKLYKKIGGDIRVCGAKGFTFGTTHTIWSGLNSVLIMGIPWFMEYPTSISKIEAENETSKREGKKISFKDKEKQISDFLREKNTLENKMKSFIQQFRGKEINIIIQEIVVNLKLKKNWDSLIFEQFGLYVTAKNNNKFPLGFDMWYDIPSEGYEWAIGNKITPFDFINTTIIRATMRNSFSQTSIK